MNVIVVPWDDAPSSLTWAEKVAYLTYQFSKLEQRECPVEHRFEPGFYIRRMHIPAATLFLGRKHNHGHEVHLVKGSAILIAPQGKRRFDAPAGIVTDPGFHAVAFTLTDVIADTRHPNPTESKDALALELDIFEPAQALIERGRVLEEKLLCQA